MLFGYCWPPDCSEVVNKTKDTLEVTSTHEINKSIEKLDAK